jgi:hypothetical protein
MDLSRLLSAILALSYLAFGLIMAILYPSREAVIALVAVVIVIALSLGMIWNGDLSGGREMGLRAFGISRYTPGCGIVLIGWVLLMLPVAVGLLIIWIRLSS